MKALLIVVLLFVSSAFSQTTSSSVPQQIANLYKDLPVVWDKKCNFHVMRGVECLILYDESRDLAWLLLFDEKMSMTYVIAITHDKKEHVVWIRSDLRI